MGRITEYLQKVLIDQINDYRIVVWFDPEQQYAQFVASFNLTDVKVARYDGSFIALRAQIDPLLDADLPPHLLVYVPLAEEETENALIELVTLGVVLKPGQAATQRNTRLAVIARRALRDSLGVEKAEELSRQVEAGKLDLADLDRLGSIDGGSAVIKSIFGTSATPEVSLAFLASDRLDAQITTRSAIDELTSLFSGLYGAKLPAILDCAQLRVQLARHVITVEFLGSLGRPLHHELESIPLPPREQQQACTELVRTWRLRRDLQSSYSIQAEQVERTLGLDRIPFTLAESQTSETFASVERALQAAVASALKNAATGEMLDLAKQHIASFWAEQRPEIQAGWSLVYTAGQLLYEADRIARELPHTAADPAALLRAYAEGKQPWCILDTTQRQLERRWHTLSDLTAQPALDALVTQARQRFMKVGEDLAETFVQSLAHARFRLPAIKRQRDTFDMVVRPALAEGKTAYVLVDALRFEMARELLQSIDSEYGGELSATIGTVPSITEIGMAALMPHASGEIEVVPTGEGKIGLRIGSQILRDRRTRLEWVKTQIPDPVAIAGLEDMLPKPKPALDQELQQARLLLITSQEIDELAESDNIRLARKVMDDVLADLARLVRKLREYGCKTIIIAADHGYLFGDELDSTRKIAPPGGQTVDLHRRAWIGRGGAVDDAVVRTSLSNFGLSTDLDIAVPRGFSAFKVSGGARAYFHGGMAPQEIVVPVLKLTPSTVGRVTPLNAIEWDLATSTKKIATRFFSVQIAARSNSLFEFDPPRVRIEVRSKGEVVAEPVSATYGLIDGTHEIELHAATGEPQTIETNTITFMITGTPGKTASIHLIDAITGRELKKLEKIDVAILAF